MRSDGEEELTTYNFHVDYELKNNVTTYRDVSIKLDPTASFQETKNNIINEIKKRFLQYSDQNIDVVFEKDKESANPDKPFNRLFPSAQVEIGIKIVLSQPRKIKINYNQTSKEFLFGDNDTFRDIQRMCKIHFNIRDEDIFSIISFKEKNYINIDQGTNVGNYLANNPESQFTIVLSNSDQGIEFYFYFQNDINHQYNNFQEKIDHRLKICDLYPFIKQRLQLKENDFFLNQNYENQWLPIKRSCQDKCKYFSPNILIVLTMPIELTIVVSFGAESHEYKKPFKLNQFISDIQKDIVNELKLRLYYNEIKLVQPCLANKTPVSELINNRILHFSVENYCINFTRYRPKVSKNKWHQIGLFEYRTIGDLKDYIVKYYNQKGYNICQEFIKIDSLSRSDIGNDKELSVGHYYIAYVPHDILFFDNNYESKSLIKENSDAYRKPPLENVSDYMTSYLTQNLKPGKYHVFYEGKEMEENDIIPIGRHVFAIQEGTPLKFVVSYKGASREIFMEQDSLIADISKKVNLDIDNPKYHVELKDGTKLMLTNERALDVFITHGNIIIITETINSLHFVTKSDGKSYYFIFRSMSTVQFIKKMLSMRFSFGNDPNPNQISLVQSSKKLDDRISVLDIVQSSNKDPIIIQSQDPSKESEFRVTYQCSYKNLDGKEAIYPLRFKSDPKIGEVVKFMASKLGFSTLKLIWKDEPLDEQPDKYFSDFQIQLEDSLIMLPPHNSATSKNENQYQLDKTIMLDQKEPQSVSDYIVDPNQYDFIRKIGFGKLGDVSLVKDENDVLYARKALYLKGGLDEEQVKKFLRECEINAAIRHPCIIRFIGFNFKAHDENATLFFEYAECDTLSSIIKNNPSWFDSTAKALCILEICFGMLHLHNNKIIHRDLKSSNILCTSDHHFKISDFGESTFSDYDGTMTNNVGTLMFMSPEILRKQEYNEKTDLFSFSMVLYHIITGSLHKLSILQIGLGERPPIPETVPSFVKEIMQQCWSQEQSERPTFKEIITSIKSNNFEIFEDVDKRLVMRRYNYLKAM